MKIWRLLILAAICNTTQASDQPLDMNSTNILSWADGVENISYGTHMADTWKTPEKALGPAAGSSYDIVCLGRGGQITLSFSKGIANGPGDDFAVFENGFSDTFLELAWVEVSSDGTHFVRFRNASQTKDPVGSFGNVMPTDITGLASEFKQGIGTQFDLAQLDIDYNDQISTSPGLALSSDFRDQLTNNYPHVDLDNIHYVRLIDIVGDGSARDAFDHVIYDPYPTVGSAGFDLDAVAVLNQQNVAGETQTITFPEIPNQKLSTGSITLSATSDSGLPISFSVQSGPATNNGSTITFLTNGVVTIIAEQSGDTIYASAAPVLRTFRIAKKLQHIWIEPIPNQLTGSTWQLCAEASSGLPVYAEVTSGPDNTIIDTNTLSITIGPDTGHVLIRATQDGDETYAPAEEITMAFDIVESEASNAPQTFTEWDKNTSSLLMHSAINQYNEPVMQFTFTTDCRVQTLTRVQTTASLSDSWNNAVPKIISTETTGDQRLITVQMPSDETNQFFRLLFEDPNQ